MAGNVQFLDAAGNAISATNPLPVTPVAGGVDQDVNLVAIGGTAAVTGSGTATAALRVELPTNGTGTLASVASVGGQVAAAATAAGNPLTLGARARTIQAGQVSDAQVAWLTAQSDGRLVVKPYQLAELEWQYAAASGGISNTNTAVTIKASGGASIRNYITAIHYMSESLTNATELAIRDGAGGTVLWRTKIPATTVVAGVYIAFPTPLKGTAATLLEVLTITASGAGAVYFNAQGYTAP